MPTLLGLVEPIGGTVSYDGVLLRYTTRALKTYRRSSSSSPIRTSYLGVNGSG